MSNHAEPVNEDDIVCGYLFRYPKSRLYFIEFKGVQYAVVADTLDDALNSIENI